jgi:plasmid stabilization system protein ParE
MTADRGFELHPGAASDITSIWEFIAKGNPLAAQRVREDILERITLIAVKAVQHSKVPAAVHGG